MARPKKIRRVGKPPIAMGMKPVGIRRINLETVTLNLDEYEAIRLSDYRKLSHKEAAEKLEVSRPTFTRLIDSAHRKISEAIIKGKEIVIEGGNIHFNNFIYICRNCGNSFEASSGESIDCCPECGSENIINRARNFGHNRGCCRRRRRRGRNKNF
ncbi:MAG: DUF134 domain-containing protein [Candidatus Mcinerneyibacterium aminivorans]|uniref:UPF0251 protein FXF47_08780 n=1 Tax=Candidatus Mcinerneyibacterium aminivorans TaxID=2703815 RepID=A0A5D0MH09_9BACT|nr:MAG: DUF134 domain-containing protein [Candidatus Mcinerneyibacterium aminivorans]